MADKWEFYTDAKGEHRWRCTAPNGEIVAAAHEGYKAEKDSKANAERHGYNGNPNGLGAKDKWSFSVDSKGEHRWERVASNGEPVGRSTEGYKKKEDAEANARRNGWTG